jgi:ABC-2 type transport system permease protein
MIRLLRLQARRDRIILPVWILGIALLVAGSTSAIGAEYGTDEQRAEILQIGLLTPALLALRGAPNGAELGSLLFFQVFTFLAVTVGLMSTFLATRHGRADEERGRRELVIAAPVPRSSSLTATLVLGLAANVAVGLLSMGGFVLGGADAEGAAVAGAALAITGIAFLGIGLLVGELVATSRAANGISSTIVVAAYVLRAAGDALGTPDLENLRLEPAWPSWLSPIGWGEQTFAFSENNLWPLSLGLGLAVVATGLAFAARSARDLGSSLLPERLGRATARPTLSTGLGLAWRLQWPSLVGWAGGTAVLGFVVGSLATAVGNAVFDNPQIAAVLQSLAHTTKDDVVALFLGSVFVLVGVLSAAAGVQAVLRLHDEESQGRMELLLSAPLSRMRLLLDAVTIGLVSTAVVIIVTAGAAWLSFVPSGDVDNAARAVSQALVQLPAAAAFVALAAVLVGALPRVATGLTWGLFAAAVVLGMFGGLLQLPEEVQKISPISNVPTVPVDDWLPTVILIAVALAMFAAAVAAFRRRDLST